MRILLRPKTTVQWMCFQADWVVESVMWALASEPSDLNSSGRNQVDRSMQAKAVRFLCASFFGQTPAYPGADGAYWTGSRSDLRVS